jgi:hypothetical protein
MKWDFWRCTAPSERRKQLRLGLQAPLATDLRALLLAPSPVKFYKRECQEQNLTGDRKS